MDELDLATHLIAAEREKLLLDVTRDEVENVRIELIHSHLPVLNEADLIIWDQDERSISTTDHPALYDPRLRFVIDQQHEAWDEVMAHLVVDRRRIALSILAYRDEPISKSTLAREIAYREHTSAPSSDAVEQTQIALHHTHLPKLRADGLIEYDTDDHTVTYCGDPELKDMWFDVQPDERPQTGHQSLQP